METWFIKPNIMLCIAFHFDQSGVRVGFPGTRDNKFGCVCMHVYITYYSLSYNLRFNSFYLSETVLTQAGHYYLIVKTINAFLSSCYWYLLALNSGDYARLENYLSLFGWLKTLSLVLFLLFW